MSSSWKETHGTLFEAIQFEKLLISLMLFLIVAVASILVLSTIVMTVKSKEREVGILKTIGANNHQLVMIFFFQGLMVSFIGYYFFGRCDGKKPIRSVLHKLFSVLY